MRSSFQQRTGRRRVQAIHPRAGSGHGSSRMAAPATSKRLGRAARAGAQGLDRSFGRMPERRLSARARNSGHAAPRRATRSSG